MKMCVEKHVKQTKKFLTHGETLFLCVLAKKTTKKKNQTNCATPAEEENNGM